MKMVVVIIMKTRMYMYSMTIVRFVSYYFLYSWSPAAPTECEADHRGSGQIRRAFGCSFDSEYILENG